MKDLKGQKFGKLTVIERGYKENVKKTGSAYWKCICECGRETVVRSDCLTNKVTSSCGMCGSHSKGSKYELANKRFGRLVVVEYIGKIGNMVSAWKCQCDCGNITYATASSLVKGQRSSCGCRFAFNAKIGKAALHRTYMIYKNGAIKRGFEFELDEEAFKEITQRDCYYCGAKPSNKVRGGKNTGDYIYNGIDRKDSKKGYVEGNILPCCGQCNTGKMDTSFEEFLEWIKRVNNHLFVENKE